MGCFLVPPGNDCRDRGSLLSTVVAEPAPDAGEGVSFLRRFGALFRKELAQIRGDRRLALSLVIPPVLQIILFGFALDSQVKNLDLGVVDMSRSRESRELVAAFTNNEAFRLDGYYASDGHLGEKLTRGELDAGLVIAPDYAKVRHSGRTEKA